MDCRLHTPITVHRQLTAADDAPHRHGHAIPRLLTEQFCGFCFFAGFLRFLIGGFGEVFQVVKGLVENRNERTGIETDGSYRESKLKYDVTCICRGRVSSGSLALQR